MKRKKETGQVQTEDICVVSRELIQVKEGKSHPILSLLVLYLCLVFGTAGLVGVFVSAFCLPCQAALVYSGIALFGLFWLGFSRVKAEGVFRFLAVLFVLIGWSVLLLLCQRLVISGFLQSANAVMAALNAGYEGNLSLYQVGENPAAVTAFLLFAAFLVSGVVSAGILYRPNVWCLAAVAFPLLFGTLLSGTAPSFGFLWLLLLALLGTMTVSVLREPPEAVRQTAAEDAAVPPGASEQPPQSGTSALAVQEQAAKNRRCYENIRSKLLVFVGLQLLVLSGVVTAAVTPGLSVPIKQLREVSMKAENGVLQAVWSLLPKVSGGRLHLSLEGTGGGVDNGALGEAEGYYFGDVEALRLTVSAKPEETVYLKGYVGTLYTGSRFEAPSGEHFANAAANWQIDGNAGLYLANLPFLRMMYAENVHFSGEGEEAAPELSGEVTSTALTLQVENLAANPAYTYVPYQAFLNDYYEVTAGDGAVAGQTAQDDIFSCYPRAAYAEKMEEWNEKEDWHGALDRVEASYESYVKSTCLKLPEDSLEELKAQCQAQELEGFEEIREYVVNTLTQNYRFNRDVEALPAGKDFVSWFLYEKKEGYSTHFAAAATMMFRACGIPARYVVGYAAPKGIFTRTASAQTGAASAQTGTVSAQTDAAWAEDSFTAVLKDDNAHAWTEVYLSGLGWTPVETTPGFVGMLEEGDYVSGTVQPEQSPADADAETAGAGSLSDADAAADQTDTAAQNSWFARHKNAGGILLSALLVLCGIAASLVLRRRLVLARRLGRLKKAGLPENMKRVYRSFYALLLLDGWEDGFSCAQEGFAEAAARKYPCFTVSQMDALVRVVLNLHYGYKEPEEKQLVFLRKVYTRLAREVYRKLSLRQRLRFCWLSCYR